MSVPAASASESRLNVPSSWPTRTSRVNAPARKVFRCRTVGQRVGQNEECHTLKEMHIGVQLQPNVVQQCPDALHHTPFPIHHAIEQRLDPQIEKLAQQCFLAGEVVEEGSFGHISRRGDLLDRGRSNPWVRRGVPQHGADARASVPDVVPNVSWSRMRTLPQRLRSSVILGQQLTPVNYDRGQYSKGDQRANPASVRRYPHSLLLARSPFLQCPLNLAMGARDRIGTRYGQRNSSGAARAQPDTKMRSASSADTGWSGVGSAAVGWT